MINCIKNASCVHYVNGDDMNKDDFWNLFYKTGKIEYYLKYKKEQENSKNGEKN